MSFPKSHGSTLSFINSLGAGPAAAMVDVCYLKKAYCTKNKNVNSRQVFRRGTAPSHSKLCGCGKDLCCRARAELS